MEQEVRDSSRQTSDPSGNLQLFLAVRRGDRAGIAELLDRHPELVDAEEEYSMEDADVAGTLYANHGTALIRAAERNDLPMFQLLVARGAAPDQRDDAGRTPVDWARENEHYSVLKLLNAAVPPVESVDQGVAAAPAH